VGRGKPKIDEAYRDDPEATAPEMDREHATPGEHDERGTPEFAAGLAIGVAGAAAAGEALREETEEEPAEIDAER
jgi:hypothetical protein